MDRCILIWEIRKPELDEDEEEEEESNMKELKLRVDIT